MRKNKLIIHGPVIYTEQGPRTDFFLGVSAGRFTHLSEKKPDQDAGAEILEFPDSYHLIPGRIDLHTHGAAGADVMDADFAAMHQIRKTLAAEGTTGFLAATLSASMDSIEKALTTVAQYQNATNLPAGSQILGFDLEGPFLSQKQPGAHRKEYLRAPDIELFKRWQTLAQNHIRLVTVAPELPNGLAFIQYLAEQNIVPSIGHSHADFKTAQMAIKLGATHATHLFNAMPPLHHREPGCVGAILLNEKVRAELIVDGHHLHPAMINLALKLKGKEGLILVTDAMRAKCCPEDHVFDLGGQKVHIENGAAKLEDGTLAGSVLGMDQAIKNMLAFTPLTLQDLIDLSSTNPAKTLNIFKQKGSIAIGKDADFVILDENYRVMRTWCGGNLIFNHDR